VPQQLTQKQTDLFLGEIVDHSSLIRLRKGCP
jgi:hypothetical protein